MARISTYAIDGTPELSDKVLGTDSNGLTTKNYPLSEIATLINNTNSLAVADQAIFSFQDNISLGRDAGTVSFIAGGGDGTSFGAVTTILLSKSAAGGKNMENFLPLFADKGIILAESGDINNFGTYTVSSIVEYTEETDFLEVTLVLSEFNGAFSNGAHYIFGEFLEGSGGSATLIQEFNILSSQWVINNTTGKTRPSVTTVTTSGVVIYGSVDYTSDTIINVNFDNTGGVAGKSYLN